MRHTVVRKSVKVTRPVSVTARLAQSPFFVVRCSKNDKRITINETGIVTVTERRNSMVRKVRVKWDPAKIRKMYRRLEAHFGDLGWWPAETPFEVIVGAVLTQNTSWVNVEKAIRAMKQKGLMNPAAIAGCGNGSLSATIRQAGYHNVKAARLKAACSFLLEECGGRLEKLKKVDTAVLREKLLAVKGIGPETADSILLYALDKPVFVVDAYTKRVFSRHALSEQDAGYEVLKEKVESVFCGRVKRLNQFHALIVETAKNYCRKKEGLCGQCPLSRI